MCVSLASRLHLDDLALGLPPVAADDAIPPASIQLSRVPIPLDVKDGSGLLLLLLDAQSPGSHLGH